MTPAYLGFRRKGRKTLPCWWKNPEYQRRVAALVRWQYDHSEEWSSLYEEMKVTGETIRRIIAADFAASHPSRA